MRHSTRTPCISLSVVVAVSFVSARARADCGNDLDCKGDRVCQNGQCVDLGFPPPPPPPDGSPPPPWTPHLHGVRSFGAIGAVGDYVGNDYGGVSLEAQHSFRFFELGLFDGGLTLNILDDVGFLGDRAPVFASLQGGVGFDFGLFRFLQFGPRFNIGYGGDLTGITLVHGPYVSLGGHVIAWLGRWVGIYLDIDNLSPISPDGPSGVRTALGLAFPWTY